MLPSLGEHEVNFLAALALIIAIARLGGELARRAGQPEVLGELVSGVLIGPSVLGLIWPTAKQWLLNQPGSGVALSGVSLIGALLMLLMAGMEVDLPLLRSRLRPGLLAATFTILPSFVAGFLVGRQVLGLAVRGAVFLGIVLSVSAISVAAKLLIERDSTRREFAQVILAGGIAAEMSAWIFVSVVTASSHGSPLLAAGRALGIAIAFFVATVALGRRIVYRAMRVAADRAVARAAPLSLVLVLTLGFGAATQALGLHALLGAFIFGVLLSRAPRANELLADRLTAVSLSLFVPAFFALAGAQVDLRRLASGRALVEVAILLVVATAAKVGFVTLGARLGGFAGAPAALVGVGLNAKGGTDVVVAILGHQLGLLSGTAYTYYTVVVLITVAFTPPLMGWLERHSPPSRDEAERLEREDAASRAYTAGLERVLVPVIAGLRPTLAVDVLEQIAQSEDRPGHLLDITQLHPSGQVTESADEQRLLAESVSARPVFTNRREIELASARLGRREGLVAGIVDAARRHDLVAIGADLAPQGDYLFNPLADALIHQLPTDVLITADSGQRHLPWKQIRRVLVPTNGLPHARAAADLAGFLAQQNDAELVLLHVRPPSGVPGLTDYYWQRYARQTAGAAHLPELEASLRRFGVPIRCETRQASDPGRAILDEVRWGHHDLIIVGALDRGADHPYLGHAVETLVRASPVPLIILVSGRRGTEAAA